MNPSIWSHSKGCIAVEEAVEALNNKVGQRLGSDQEYLLLWFLKVDNWDLNNC